MKKASPRKRGRPSEYTTELATLICKLISEGTSLRDICKRDDMPNRDTVHTWLLDLTKKDFSDQYNKACNTRAENMFDELIKIADDTSQDTLTRENSDGTEYDVQNTEYIQRSRLRVDVRKWYLSKVMPKKYGDKMDFTTNGKDLPTPIMPFNVIQPDNSNAEDNKPPEAN